MMGDFRTSGGNIPGPEPIIRPAALRTSIRVMPDIDLSIPSQPHQIAELAYGLYGAQTPGIGDAEVQALQARLDEIYPDLQEAYHALLALTAFSLFVKQTGDEASSVRIMGLVRSQAPRFETVKHQVADQNSALKEQFSKLAALDTSSDKVAPKFGADAPEGSLKASSLLPNPALRRPPSRK